MCIDSVRARPARALPRVDFAAAEAPQEPAERAANMFLGCKTVPVGPRAGEGLRDEITDGWGCCLLALVEINGCKASCPV